ncbi:hypothetical protein KFE25_013734 [Diacronema lutheri]|uniref:Uncharacterized protein n=1 Tax=Diacronema lutheri TaxID=2081491 RepID=A0A8J6CF14_DIALT|nr:hypothetical protein KFE25_013734 [Diacronema lutheri]
MFSLIAGLFEYLFKKAEFQVLILGVDHAGKTTALEQMKGLFQKIEPLAPEKIPPTVGLNIGRMEVGRVKLIFWDLGGQSGLRGIWEKYFAEVHGLVYVIDAADDQRFDESRRIFEALVKHPDLAGVPVLILANKQDLHSAATIDEIDERFGFGSLCAPSQQYRIEPVSAITGSGIADGITWMVDMLKLSSRGVTATQ